MQRRMEWLRNREAGNTEGEETELVVSKTDSRRGQWGKIERNSLKNSSQGSGVRISWRKEPEPRTTPGIRDTATHQFPIFISPYWELWGLPCPADPGGFEPKPRTSPTEQQSQRGFQKYLSQGLEKLLNRFLTRNTCACKFMLFFFLRQTGEEPLSPSKMSFSRIHHPRKLLLSKWGAKQCSFRWDCAAVKNKAAKSCFTGRPVNNPQALDCLYAMHWKYFFPRDWSSWSSLCILSSHYCRTLRAWKDDGSTKTDEKPLGSLREEILTPASSMCINNPRIPPAESTKESD